MISYLLFFYLVSLKRIRKLFLSIYRVAVIKILKGFNGAEGRSYRLKVNRNLMRLEEKSLQYKS